MLLSPRERSLDTLPELPLKFLKFFMLKILIVISIINYHFNKYHRKFNFSDPVKYNALLIPWN